MRQMIVEVERKFTCSGDTLKTLEEIGVCVGQRQFLDQYFDTPEFELTLRDLWLRKRKECWELKCPAEMVTGTEEPSGEQSLCTRYKEITNLPEIYMKVKEVIKEGCKDGESGPSLDDDSWLRKLNLVCFAEYTTVRQSFTLGEEGLQIDLDQADFGYNVGEIEVLIPEGGDVQSAQEKIRNAAQKLGLTGDEQVEGKMHVYLKRYHPEHYAKLLSAHIL
ncbi:thiamine-triphosphatase isoform X2 [Melanotaenia boesemani]|uniref:thiamine-triphosphatase isoform X2 n=1 Tax=Melanotaenia boesemani TaxID=1250792 RepID=UPI001C04D3AE|nr:thiamine-triphosphatase isoform X2 [Melanotaenia boesemani]